MLTPQPQVPTECLQRWGGGEAAGPGQPEGLQTQAPTPILEETGRPTAAPHPHSLQQGSWHDVRGHVVSAAPETACSLGLLSLNLTTMFFWDTPRRRTLQGPESFRGSSVETLLERRVEPLSLCGPATGLTPSSPQPGQASEAPADTNGMGGTETVNPDPKA